MSHFNVLCIDFHSLPFPLWRHYRSVASMKTHRKYLPWPALQSKVRSVWTCSHFHSYFLISTIFWVFLPTFLWNYWQKAEKETLEIVLKHLNKIDEPHFLFGHQRLGRIRLSVWLSVLPDTNNSWMQNLNERFRLKKACSTLAYLSVALKLEIYIYI